jgi:class 3 adenylate cyclase
MFTDGRLHQTAEATGQDATANTLLGLLNSLAAMIEVVSARILQFTGILLAQFQPDRRQSGMVQAVRAGLRMQRAMSRFASIETPQGTFSLGMRVGIHAGRFLTADIGTPRRIEHVLLGGAVQQTKRAEGAGKVGRVCLTEMAYQQVKDQFRFEPGNPGYLLVVDEFTSEQLGEYDIAPASRRLASSVLFDRSVEGLMTEIEQTVSRVEPLASYLPSPILNLLIESASRRQIPPDFVEPTVVFVNLLGLPEAVDHASPDEVPALVTCFSRAFSLINAAVEARGGVLKKVTYHLAGSDIMIYFGVPSTHTDDPIRATEAALAIRDIVDHLDTPMVGDERVNVTCQIGISRGPAFAAEIGEMRGRREFNVLGDTVNTTARLMGRATTNQILLTEAVYRHISQRFECESLGPISLKGKAAPTPLYILNKPLDS